MGTVAAIEKPTVGIGRVKLRMAERDFRDRHTSIRASQLGKDFVGSVEALEFYRQTGRVLTGVALVGLDAKGHPTKVVMDVWNGSGGYLGRTVRTPEEFVSSSVSPPLSCG